MRSDGRNLRCQAVADAREERRLAASRGVTLGRGLSVRPCACGGRVYASITDPTPGVREHNATPEHRRWAAERQALLAELVA